MTITKKPKPSPKPKPRPILPLGGINAALDPALSRFRQLLPVQRTWARLDTVSGDELNQNVRDATNFLLSPPRAHVTMLNQDQTIQPYSQTGGTLQILQFDTVEWDTDQMWDSSTPSRFYFNTPGLYKWRIYLHFGIPQTPGVFQAGIARLSGGLWPFNSTGPGLLGPKLYEDTRQGVQTNLAGTTCYLEGFYNSASQDDYIEAFAGCTHSSSFAQQVNYASFQIRYVAEA